MDLIPRNLVRSVTNFSFYDRLTTIDEHNMAYTSVQTRRNLAIL